MMVLRMVQANCVMNWRRKTIGLLFFIRKMQEYQRLAMLGLSISFQQTTVFAILHFLTQMMAG